MEAYYWDNKIEYLKLSAYNSEGNNTEYTSLSMNALQSQSGNYLDLSGYDLEIVRVPQYEWP